MTLASRLSFAVLLGSTLFAAPAFAQPATSPSPSQGQADEPLDEARTRVQRGSQLYDEGAYEAARAEFQRAYELTKKWKILYNLALVSAQLHDFVTALKQYSAYLEQGGSEIASDRRALVEKEVAALRQRVARIEVTTPVAGADVALDDEPMGKAPLKEPLLVNPGKHRVTVSAPEKMPMTKVFELAVGQTAKDTFDLAPIPKETETKIVTVEVPAEKKKPLRPLPVALWIGTGALTAGAVVTGVLALSAQSRLADSRAQPQGDPVKLDAQSKNTKAFALVTDILGGAAIVCGGVALYVTLKKDTQDASPTKASLDVGVGPGNVSFRGTF